LAVRKDLKWLQAKKSKFVVEESTLEVAAARWNQLEEKFGRSSFLEMPRDLDELGLDGQTIVLETLRSDGNYHAVKRWSPDDGTFMQLVKEILSLAEPGSEETQDHRIDPRRDRRAATFSGLVLGIGGKPMPKAIVVINGAGVQESRVATEGGKFGFLDLVPGEYEVHVRSANWTYFAGEDEYSTARHLRIEGHKTCAAFRVVPRKRENVNYDWDIDVGCDEKKKSVSNP